MLNNAQNAKRAKLIRSECERVGASHLRVDFKDREMRKSHFARVFRFGQYMNPSLACSYAFHWFTKKHLSQLSGGTVVYIDSDMFLIKPVNFSQLTSINSLYYVPQYRGTTSLDEYEVLYPWSGLMIASTMDKRIELSRLEWSPKPIKGYATDIGGAAMSWLETSIEEADTSELLFLSLLKYKKDNSHQEVELSLNGNWNAKVKVSLDGGNGCFSSHDELSLASRILRVESSEVERVVVERLRGIMSIVHPNSWPDPIHLDLLSAPEIKLDNFIFHYKSGSNYQPWVTDEYNSIKTEAYRRLIDS